MKILALTFVVLSLIAIPATVEAAPCKDAKGKFIKCPPAKPTTNATPAPKANPAPKSTAAQKANHKQCRDAKGRFAKCK